LQQILIEMLIVPQGDYIRSELLDGLKDILLLSQDGPVHDLECSYHPSPLLLGQDGLGLVADIDIPGHNHHQLVPQCPGALQVKDMAGVEEVKCSRGHYQGQGSSSPKWLIHIFIEFIIKAVVFEINIQDRQITPLSRTIITYPGALVIGGTDDDVIVAGAGEEEDIRLGRAEKPGRVAVGGAGHGHIGQHIEAHQSAHAGVLRAGEYEHITDDILFH